MIGKNEVAVVFPLYIKHNILITIKIPSIPNK